MSVKPKLPASNSSGVVRPGQEAADHRWFIVGWCARFFSPTWTANSDDRWHRLPATWTFLSQDMEFHGGRLLAVVASTCCAPMFCGASLKRECPNGKIKNWCVCTVPTVHMISTCLHHISVFNMQTWNSVCVCCPVFHGRWHSDTDVWAAGKWSWSGA